MEKMFRILLIGNIPPDNSAIIQSGLYRSQRENEPLLCFNGNSYNYISYSHVFSNNLSSSQSFLTSSYEILDFLFGSIQSISFSFLPLEFSHGYFLSKTVLIDSLVCLFILHQNLNFHKNNLFFFLNDFDLN